MKNKWITLILSFILPGLGHIYLKNLKAGIPIAIISIISIILSELIHSSFGFIYLLLWLYTMIISFKITRQYNKTV